MNSVFGVYKNIHFVGIGGIGMSGIAEVLHSMGFIVSGSDMSESSNIERLRSMDIDVSIGHDASNVDGKDVLVHSSAIKADNPEILTARDRHIPVISRGEMLSELMRLKYAVAVAGSHGKTTTTSMIAEIVTLANLDPTIIIGGRLNSINNNAALGRSNIMVAEADESDRSFLMLYPTVGVITNIDYEHMENYKDFNDVKESFAKFANRVPFYGCCVMCVDDDNVADIIPLIEKRFTTYGTKTQADIKAINIKKRGFGVKYTLVSKGVELGKITLKLPGDHIVYNSLAAISVALELGIDFEIIQKSLAEFTGVQRRMSIRFDGDKHIVIDDYGHHPTEITATLKAIREAMPNNKIVAIFQPHRYSRTENLMAEFSKCFMDADKLFITDIYAASEQPIEGIDSHALIKSIKKHGVKDVNYLEYIEDFYSFVDDLDTEKVAIITFGAGDITKFSYKLADYFNEGTND